MGLFKDRSPVQGRKIGGRAPSDGDIRRAVTQAHGTAKTVSGGECSVEITPGVWITVHDTDKINDVVAQVKKDLEGY